MARAMLPLSRTGEALPDDASRSHRSRNNGDYRALQHKICNQ
jgi:hypothetical protein